MKKLTILVVMILAAAMLSAEMYTGIPEFLPYGVNCINQPMAPGWYPQKADVNGFQGCFYYDAYGNKHEGKGHPKLKVFYERGPINDLPGTKKRITRVEKALMWLIKRFCEIYGYRVPAFE